MLHSIHVAGTGLAASKTSVENVMNNVTNEHTDGYKKRRVNLSEMAHIDNRQTGRGVMIDDTTRATEKYLYNNLMNEESKQNYYQELSQMLANVESVFHETDNSGFAYDLDRYFNALENLRSNPKNEIYKNDVKSQAKILVEDMKNLYGNLENIQKATKNKLHDDVEAVNDLLNKVGEINKKLGKNLGDRNDLMDKRDLLERKLSEFVDIEVERIDGYTLSIGGIVAVRHDTNVHDMQVKEDYQRQVNSYTADYYNYPAEKTIKIALNNTDYMYIKTDYFDTRETINTKIMDAINSTVGFADALSANLNNVDDLVVRSNVEGEKGAFDLRIVVQDDKRVISRDETRSKDGLDDIHVEVFDERLESKSGTVKALSENLITTDEKNKIYQYKQQLDNFAKALSDQSDQYIRNMDGSYIYGEYDMDRLNGPRGVRNLDLFSGSNVRTLEFKDASVPGLTQEDLDYLTTIQWREDINFDGEHGAETSFSKYYQKLQVNIASNKEDNDFTKETQEAVTISLNNNYDKLTKVDKDEEMVKLMEFQAAYEASAKLITVSDEMLQTILNM